MASPKTQYNLLLGNKDAINEDKLKDVGEVSSRFA